MSSRVLAICSVATWYPTFALGTTLLADQPVLGGSSVPGNLALALSVEFPTAISVAHTDSVFSPDKTYLGYFDPNKCYGYNFSTDEKERYFFPAGGSANRKCSGQWSGNFLNWATMQTIDPFRWVLTGGYRAVDLPDETRLERAWASNQGGFYNFPNRSVDAPSLISQHTPLKWSSLQLRNWAMGNKLVFSRSASLYSVPAVVSAAQPLSGVKVFDPSVKVDDAAIYEVTVRVKVCDSSSGAGPLESNCTAYPNGGFKPTGLIQQYSRSLRYSAFGYLTDPSNQRDGGVLRARQKFVGPTQPSPSGAPTSNLQAEWSAFSGVILPNPDSADAADSTSRYGVSITNSGVINYLNKFGQLNPGNYKIFDPVSELYYAALRYFKNLGNVPEWSAVGSTDTATKRVWLDGFPAITAWDDPIQYSCQRNFVLGIGDVNSNADKNVPGSGMGTTAEPPRPASLADDWVDAVLETNRVGMLHNTPNTRNLGTQESLGGCCSGNSALIAGLAYDANARDIRPDKPGDQRTRGKQTVQTYWLDVLEGQSYRPDNQFYLAAKYGGARLPDNFDANTRTTDLPLEWWSTSGEKVGSGSELQDRPDNYFTGNRPELMVQGLTRAFAKIFSDLGSYSTSIVTASPQVRLSGSASYGAKFDPATWTGDVEASSLDTDTGGGEPRLTLRWSFERKLATQIAERGWDTARAVVTWNTDSATPRGVPFRLSSLSASQREQLNTSYRSGDDSQDFLNYLRGDPTHEEGSTLEGSSRSYRKRAATVADISGSRVRPVGPPAAPFSNSANPGYGAFKLAWAQRPTVVYVGTNGGMLHAIDGALQSGPESATPGREIFAYVPGALYQGPSGKPGEDGLASRGNPNFAHRALVDGPISAFDIDFGRTEGGGGSPDWRTVLVGALGKGGRSYFAIDVTDPTMGTKPTESATSAESKIAKRVLWEFSHPKLGFTYGAPSAVKTKKYGWVLVFGSGYNNADGRGYFFIVNPRTGKLLEDPIDTGVGSSTQQAGLAHVQAYLPDRTDGTADSVYAGDLLGNLWRLDLTATTGAYPAPVQLAVLTDKDGYTTPITARPLVMEHPSSRTRYVAVGTGRLLHADDVASSQRQVFVAIADGSGTVFGGTLPAGMTYPIRRAQLAEVQDLQKPAVIDPKRHRGWMLELGSADSVGGPGWRVISESSSFYGTISFSSMLPSVDSCSPAGKSRVYTIDVESAQTAIADLVPFVSVDNQVVDVRNYNVEGKRRLMIGDVTGKIKGVNVAPPPPKRLKKLNWREVPLAE